MIQVTITDLNLFISFWLVFVRWQTIIMQFPLFDSETVPVQAKVLSALLISFCFFPTVAPFVQKDLNYYGVDSFWYLTIVNVVIGLVVGFLIKAIMEIFVSAGGLITQQVGFSALRYFDPSTSEQIGIFEQLIKWSMVLIIISSGALLPMFKGVIGTFANINLSNMDRLLMAPEFYLSFFKSVFLASLSLAAPLIYTNILLAAVMGILSRTVPQLNVLMVSFVVNIGVGLLVFLATSDEFFIVSNEVYNKHLADWFQFITTR